MRYRRATTRDLNRLTEITLSSLQDDPAFDYMWPHRREFPDDNSFFWSIHLKKLLYDPNMTFLVVELEEEDAENLKEQEKELKPEPMPGTVVSYGIWERIGKDRAARRRAGDKDTWQNKLDGLTASAERWSVSRKYKRRDGSSARLSASDAATEGFRREFFNGAGGSSNWWSMELLVTDRPYRGRGAATQIIDWGCSVADKEGLYSGVEASPMGEAVYGKAGFEKMGMKTIRVKGEDEALTYAVMVRRPTRNSLERRRASRGGMMVRQLWESVMAWRTWRSRSLV